MPILVSSRKVRCGRTDTFHADSKVLDNKPHPDLTTNMAVSGTSSHFQECCPKVVVVRVIGTYMEVVLAHTPTRNKQTCVIIDSFRVSALAPIRKITSLVTPPPCVVCRYLAP